MNKPAFGLCLLILASVTLAELPTKDSLGELRLKWLMARRRALAPIDDTYIKQLEVLKLAETKKGNLEGALRIEEERKKVEQDLAMDETATASSDAMRTSLSTSKWTGMEGGLKGWKFQFKANGAIDLTQPDGAPGWGGWGWKVNDDGKLWIYVPSDPSKPWEVKISKKLDRMAFGFGGAAGSTMSRVNVRSP